MDKEPASCQSVSGSEHKEILSETQCQVVSGARRVWGTLQSATLYAVRATIVKLTKCIEADDLRVKRKCGLTNSGKTKWWFVLHGKEEMLKSLEENWSKVSVQTGWRLEQCTKPSDTMSTMLEQMADNVPIVGDDKLTNDTAVASTASTDVNTISTEMNCSEDMEPNTLSNQDHRSTGRECLNESHNVLGSQSQ